eukprot:TRINITY_DN17264_c0_g1_i1.p1 TRINITY_DN17264_c0_g1~~TRINITY_DN17264_c0_g1_i1.p1  ORF type:complete len:589 (-),score=40.87 TRINITY_DN17264_c0_g1_i1:259-2025(-)
MPKFLLSSLCYLLVLSSVHGTLDTQVYPWPKPRKAVWGNSGLIPIDPAFRILVPNHKYLQEAALRYEALVFAEKWSPIGAGPVSTFNIVESQACGFSRGARDKIRKLEVLVEKLDADLQHGVDESYTLSVPAKGGVVNVTAKTPWGAIRGLETFSQLVLVKPGNTDSVSVNEVWIEDSPIFAHRGLLLDTSRNFYPVEDILRTIRALSYNKMNVFHWHITDSHSFPLDLKTEPELARKGAYSLDMRYSAEDVKKIVEFGKSHGVRVIPEIDTPGHTASWAEAYPDIVTCAGEFWYDPSEPSEDRLAAEPGAGQLNPLNPSTYKVVNNVLKEVTETFPEQMFHAGADEITTACWETDTEIQEYLKSDSNLSHLLEQYVSKTNTFLTKSCNKTSIIYWEDILLSEKVHSRPQFLPKQTTILQTWNDGPKNTKIITSMGYRAIVSSADYYYLDCGHGGWLGNDSRYTKNPSEDLAGGSWCAPFKTWQTIYNYDITQGLTEQESRLVLGGEVALWSEQSDAVGMDGRIWPRASAMAESLWSGNRDEKGRRRYAEAILRLNQWRYRMLRRGIYAEPLQPLWCLQNPGMCNRNA